MADSLKVECHVTVPDDQQIEEFSNAFRVIQEVGPDCILDFLIYSSLTKHARVVSRLRVRRDFLPAIQERLRDFLIEFPTETATPAPPVQPEKPVLEIKGSQVTLSTGEIVVWHRKGGDSEN